MPKKWRHWALCMVLAIGSVLAAWSLDEFRFFQILNLKAYDAHFVVRDRLLGRPPISNIVLLTANQKTMDTFPEPKLFWNKHYADAIAAAGEAGRANLAPPHEAVQSRRSLEQLTRCVSSAIDREQVDAHTRMQLASLWQYLRHQHRSRCQVQNNGHVLSHDHGDAGRNGDNHR